MERGEAGLEARKQRIKGEAARLQWFELVQRGNRHSVHSKGHADRGYRALAEARARQQAVKWSELRGGSEMRQRWVMVNNHRPMEESN